MSTQTIDHEWKKQQHITPPPKKTPQNKTTYSQASRHGLSYTCPSTPQTGLYTFPGQEQNGASVADGYCSVGVISPVNMAASDVGITGHGHSPSHSLSTDPLRNVSDVENNVIKVVTLTKSVHVWSAFYIQEVDQSCSENVNSFLKKNSWILF